MTFAFCVSVFLLPCEMECPPIQTTCSISMCNETTLCNHLRIKTTSRALPSSTKATFSMFTCLGKKTTKVVLILSYPDYLKLWPF